MDVLILVTMKSSPCMDKDCRYCLWLLPHSQHAIQRAVGAVRREFRKGGGFIVMAV